MKNFLKMSCKEFVEAILLEQNKTGYVNNFYFHRDEKMENGAMFMMDGRVEKRTGDIVCLFLSICNSHFRIDILVKNVFNKDNREYFVGDKKVKPKMKIRDALISFQASYKRKEIKKLNDHHARVLEYLEDCIKSKE